MPRYPRMFLAGYPHHVVQRGHDRQPVFITDEDYLYYLENLQDQKQALQVRLYAWCLMTNHVHLILEPRTDSDAISKLMRVLAARQTRRINRLEHRSGTLWEGRFKCSLIDTEEYLLTCMRYVELNPVRAAMTADPAEYHWSSCRDRLAAQALGWLDDHPLYESLGCDRRTRQNCYRRFLAEGLSEDELTMIQRALQRNQLTGSDRFAEVIEARTGRRVLARGPGRPRK